MTRHWPKYSFALAAAVAIGAALLPATAGAAGLERFRASVYPATGEVFACRSNSDLMCAYSRCVERHPDAAEAGAQSPCQKLSVADIGKGTEQFCSVGLYHLTEGIRELFGAVGCAATAQSAEQAVRAWAAETGKTITYVRTYSPTGLTEAPPAGAGSPAEPTPGRIAPAKEAAAPAASAPPVARSESPPYVVIFTETTNGRHGGGAWAYCTNSDRGAARRCAEASCSKYAEYGTCIETGASGRGGYCAVAIAKKFGISWAGCDTSREGAHQNAITSCDEQGRRFYPDKPVVCEIVWEQKG